jgi:CRISPR/Cas system-associated endonuclease Cas1
MSFKFSRHVEDEIKRRKIFANFVESVLQNPQQIVEEYGNKKAYQSKVDFGEGKVYLLRVIVADNVDPAIVVTVYRTSKVKKYWREQ